MRFKLWPRDLFGPSLAITVLAVAVLVGALLYVTRSTDDSTRDVEQAVVANGVNVEMSEIADDAAAQITLAPVRDFGRWRDAAWAQTNLAEPLAHIPGVDLVYVIDQHDRPFLAMNQGERVSVSAYADIAAAQLITSVRQLEAALLAAPAAGNDPGPPLQSSGIVRIGDRVYVLTASLIRETPTASDALSPIVITGAEINDDFLSVLSDSLLLDNFRLHPVGAAEDPASAQIELSDAAGKPVATLRWAPRTPGAELLRSALPPVLMLIAGLGFLGFALYQRGRQSARSLVASEARATHLAYHDALTGLPNRLLLADQLGRAIENLRRHNTPFAIHCIDLDRFKDVNDSLGHAAGDEVIRLSGQRITDACRQSDTIARLGGDEFAIIQIGADADGAASLAARLVAVLSEPMDLTVGRVHIGASIGISLLTDGATEPLDCMRQADLALYRAKEGGRGRYAFFEPEMDAKVRTRKALQEDLRTAIEEGQLFLVYQPQVDATGKTIGVEALVRWNHPVRGSLSPSLFVPIAEESGLIDALGFFTLRRAFEDGRRWPSLTVAVNISATQLRMKDFADKLDELVEECDVDATHFELEITEGLLLGDDPQTHETLRRIRADGFSIALDDFGTGYSSLSYLQRYPIDRIKIDRSFVSNLGASPAADAVVSAIVKLARALNLTVIAEGVETNEQRQHLARAGCTEVQGFLFGAPSTPEFIDALVAREQKTAVRLVAG